VTVCDNDAPLRSLWGPPAVTNREPLRSTDKSRPHASNRERTLAFTDGLDYYDNRRPHTAGAGRPLISRLADVMAEYD
jgi:hypothetical protein